MEGSIEPTSFALPLELQFAMRKAEMQANEMTWEQLHEALLNLYHQRLMEWHAVRAIMSDENIQIDFDLPTEVELMELAVSCMADEDEEDEESEGFQPF
jgi:DNA-directed RNA polymerase|tara:strand:- start:475 stop:771 length:297 start_codon:yes stop_codon:yes gene_type:complete